jgi:hypothetical protein
MVDVLFTVYHRRAIQLASAMKLCQDDLAAYASAAALLAVHSAISYSDAVLIGTVGRRSRREDHRQAAIAHKRACAGAKIDQRGIAHLQTLLSVKTDISYGDQLIDNERIAALCNTAERFQTWAERVLTKKEGRQSL